VRNILGQYLWHNTYIRIAGHTVLWENFADAGLSHLGQLCADHGLKTWNQVGLEFQLNQNLQFKFLQLLNAIPILWKNMIAEVLPIPDLEEAKHTQGLLHCTRMVPTEKLTSKTLSDILLRNAGHIPTAQTTLQTKFPNVVADDWKSIFYRIGRQLEMPAHAAFSIRY
jgi:hypothetical protein